MRRHPLFAFALLMMWGATVAAQPARKILSRREYRSPDHALVATVVSLKQSHPYGDNPSLLEIRDASGHRIAHRDHSLFPNQGYRIEKAAWTADARFFVYIVSDAGGHSPWHHPIFFYSRKRQRFYSLDEALGKFGPGDGSITGDMQLRSPCTLITKGRYYGRSQNGLHTSTEPGDQSGEKLLQIDLRWLERHLTRSSISTDKEYK